MALFPEGMDTNSPPMDLDALAKKELGETPELQQSSLERLRELLKGEDSLLVPPDDSFLLMFLRARKYRVNDAFTTVKNYFRVRRDVPEYFDKLTPSNIAYQTVCYEHKLLLSSKDRDPQRRAAGYINFGAWNTGICSLTELMRCLLLAAECNLLAEETQIRGAIAIVDMKGFGAHHLMALSPWFLRRIVFIVTQSLPTRIKGFYFINTPTVFSVVFSLIRSLVPAKLKERFRLLGNDISTLHEVLPRDFIPKEFGGTREDFDYHNQKKFFHSRASHFERVRKFGYQSSRSSPTAYDCA
ncbi:alpha-tocopherol transfer protein-like isoform X1 [Amblyomma americanum]